MNHYAISITCDTCKKPKEPTSFAILSKTHNTRRTTCKSCECRARTLATNAAKRAQWEREEEGLQNAPKPDTTPLKIKLMEDYTKVPFSHFESLGYTPSSAFALGFEEIKRLATQYNPRKF